jgi:hypothetical protein
VIHDTHKLFAQMNTAPPTPNEGPRNPRTVSFDDHRIMIEDGEARSESELEAIPNKKGTRDRGLPDVGIGPHLDVSIHPTKAFTTITPTPTSESGIFIPNSQTKLKRNRNMSDITFPRRSPRSRPVVVWKPPSGYPLSTPVQEHRKRFVPTTDKISRWNDFGGDQSSPSSMPLIMPQRMRDTLPPPAPSLAPDSTMDGGGANGQP